MTTKPSPLRSSSCDAISSLPAAATAAAVSSSSAVKPIDLGIFLTKLQEDYLDVCDLASKQKINKAENLRYGFTLQKRKVLAELEENFSEEGAAKCQKLEEELKRLNNSTNFLDGVFCQTPKTLKPYALVYMAYKEEDHERKRNSFKDFEENYSLSNG